MFTERTGLLVGATILMTIGVLAPISWLHGAVLPLALVLPGYAVLTAAFGRGPQLDPLPAIALSSLLSLAIYALLALALNAASIRLSRESVLAASDCLIALLVALSLPGVRPWRALAEDSIPLPDEPRPLLHRIRMDLKNQITPPRRTESIHLSWPGHGWALGYLTAIVLSGLALVVILQHTAKPADAPFTQFYFAGSWARISGIVDLAAGKTLGVEVGITNHTHLKQLYLLKPILEPSIRWPMEKILLAPGSTWSGMLRGPIIADNCVHRLAIQLRSAQNHPAVSSLTLWVRGAASGAVSCRSAHA